MMRSDASAMGMPVFLRLWVSLAETPMQSMSTPAACARSIPFSFRTSPERRAVAGRGSFRSSWKSRSVSAICGTFVGWTKEPTWTTSSPAAMRARIHASFVS